MDESVVKHLEQSEKPSALIRRGIPVVKETFTYIGCALGTAFCAKAGRTITSDDKRADTWCHSIADFIGLPRAEARHVSHLHSCGASREECADWLESQGY